MLATFYVKFSSGRNGASAGAEVVAICDERIREGCIKREDTKKLLVRSMEEHLREMEQDADPTIVWQPMSEAGFGASPFNPNCWRRTDGSPILSQEVWRTVSKDLKVMRAEIYKK